MGREIDLRKYRTIQVPGVASDTSLQSIISQLQQVNTNLDEIELLADNINITLGNIDSTSVNILASVQDIAITNDNIFEEITATGTRSNGVETVVGETEVNIAPSNANRKKLIIQNTGNANARIGITGVTVTTGFRLVPGGSMVLEPPYVESNAIFAIREGLVNTIILTQETT